MAAKKNVVSQPKRPENHLESDLRKIERFDPSLVLSPAMFGQPMAQIISFTRLILFT